MNTKPIKAYQIGLNLHAVGMAVLHMGRRVDSQQFSDVGAGSPITEIEYMSDDEAPTAAIAASIICQVMNEHHDPRWEAFGRGAF